VGLPQAKRLSPRAPDVQIAWSGESHGRRTSTAVQFGDRIQTITNTFAFFQPTRKKEGWRKRVHRSRARGFAYGKPRPVPRDHFISRKTTNVNKRT
jgi:hypothetical protein